MHPTLSHIRCVLKCVRTFAWVRAHMSLTVNHQVFVANNDSTMAITNTLDAPVLASVIRLTNFTTAVGGKPGLRVSLLGCKEPSVFSGL